MLKKKNKRILFDLLIIALGACIYAFGLVEFNIANDLSDGGIAGITLILRAVFHINPAYSFFIINLPLIWVSKRYLGQRNFWYAVFGSVALSGFLKLWTFYEFPINIGHDLLIASLFAGLLAGIGLGIIFRVGGSTDGADILARILQRKREIPMGQSLFIFDIVVMSASLVYIDLKHFAYTLIASFVFMIVSNGVANGGYAVRGLLIISNKSELIGAYITTTLGHDVTYIDGKGGYSGEDKQLIYIVLSPRELIEVKQLILTTLDPKAFISVLNVHEAIGRGFARKVK